MDKNEVKNIINKVIENIKNNELECFRQMAYMNEHKFFFERDAIRYKQEAYNECWLELSDALDDIMKLEK